MVPWSPGPLALLSTVAKPMRQLFLVIGGCYDYAAIADHSIHVGDLYPPSHSSFAPTIVARPSCANSVVSRASLIIVHPSSAHHPSRVDGGPSLPRSRRLQTPCQRRSTEPAWSGRLAGQGIGGCRRSDGSGEREGSQTGVGGNAGQAAERDKRGGGQREGWARSRTHCVGTS